MMQSIFKDPIYVKLTEAGKMSLRQRCKNTNVAKLDAAFKKSVRLISYRPLEKGFRVVFCNGRHDKAEEYFVKEDWIEQNQAIRDIMVHIKKELLGEPD
jgi:hypothetical protein